MHKLSTSFVLGFHGCDKSIADVLIDGEEFHASENDHDWLGWGIYFWEANPARGLEFAHALQKRRVGKPNAIKEPYVVGAVIDMGFCLDLMTSTGIAAVKAAHESLKTFFQTLDKPMLENTHGSDLLLRKRDCAVINHLHALRESAGLPKFDSVRGVFIEGDPIYNKSGFFEKTHIQVCVCNPACIKGIFRVTASDLAAA
ncbi:MAG: hypothetical protein JOY76_08930 [Hyphomicrobiales bacterium]|nr:hypothetical protein [Hyphomicrobiales bacterium]